MLGGLARWLRAAGYDASWHDGIDDGELVRLCHAEGGPYSARRRRVRLRWCGTASCPPCSCRAATVRTSWPTSAPAGLPWRVAVHGLRRRAAELTKVAAADGCRPQPGLPRPLLGCRGAAGLLAQDPLGRIVERCASRPDGTLRREPVPSIPGPGSGLSGVTYRYTVCSVRPSADGKRSTFPPVSVREACDTMRPAFSVFSFGNGGRSGRAAGTGRRRSPRASASNRSP
jgi:hypothetical protein